jgi:thymidylate synthase
MVNAWNVVDVKNGSMVLPPCHYGFQVWTRELSVKERMEIYFKQHPDWAMIGEHLFFDKHNIPTRAISLMFNMRSSDVPLGLPFNIASYGLLLEIIGKLVNMIPNELIANLGDAHIYLNQVEGCKEQLTRTPMKLPNLTILDSVNFNGTIDDFLDSYTRDSFKIEGYESHPTIKMPLSN